MNQIINNLMNVSQSVENPVKRLTNGKIRIRLYQQEFGILREAIFAYLQKYQGFSDHCFSLSASNLPSNLPSNLLGEYTDIVRKKERKEKDLHFYLLVDVLRDYFSTSFEKEKLSLSVSEAFCFLNFCLEMLDAGVPVISGNTLLELNRLFL